MITFTAPATSAFFTTDTDFSVDRAPTTAKQVRMLTQPVQYAVLEQSRADGINAVTEEFNFNIVNLTNAEAWALDGYFNELKGSEAIVFTFPTGTKKYQITSWSLAPYRGVYASISAKCEEVFL